MSRVLVLGLGNLLLADEGLGVTAVETLRDRYLLPADVDVVDGGTAGMDLIDIIAGHDAAIIVDAVRTGDGPGTVVVVDGDEVPAVFRQGMSPHQIGLPDVLAAMALLDLKTPRLVVVGTEPVEIRPMIGLSPGVAATMPALLETVVDQLARFGVIVRERPTTTG